VSQRLVSPLAPLEHFQLLHSSGVKVLRTIAAFLGILFALLLQAEGLKLIRATKV
jgi:hypothetical protein